MRFTQNEGLPRKFEDLSIFLYLLVLSRNDVFVRKAMKNPISEPFKVSVSVSVAFQDFDFVVTSLGKTVGVWRRQKNLVCPYAN